jgi:ribosome-binding factor A
MQREFSRNQRMSSLILRALNKIIRFDVDDPSLHKITLTAIDLSQDLSIAKVYFSSLDFNGDIDVPKKALKRATGYIRKSLGSEIKIRHIPELRFFHDQSSEKAHEISELIRKSKVN